MTTFNSISEIVNTVANFNNEPFILVPSYTGEYIPNWDIITEDGPNAKEGNHFLTLPEDDITHLTIDEQKEIEELVSLLPSNTVLHSISVQQLSTGEFAYTYVFKRSCTPYPTNFQASKALSAAIPKFNAFFNMVNDLTEYAGHYYITPIPNTDIVLGTFVIG